ncbi:MAG: hypothetical protein AB7K24_23440 [Gemmataceae bacterium]
MSHLVTVKTRVQDVAAVEAACRRLNLPAPVPGTAAGHNSMTIGLSQFREEWVDRFH